MIQDYQDFEFKIKRMKFTFYIIYTFLIMVLIFGSFFIIQNLETSSLGSSDDQFTQSPETISDSSISVILPNFNIEIIILISLFLFGSILSIQSKNISEKKIIKNFYDAYHITRLKDFSGQIFFENVTLNVDWNKKKKFFVISHKNNILSLTKPKELYWKILYWNHKLSA